MQKFILDTVNLVSGKTTPLNDGSTCTTNAYLVGHYTDWQGRRHIVDLPQDESFLWCYRSVRVGPDGGATDTVLGEVDPRAIMCYLEHMPPKTALSWQEAKSVMRMTVNGISCFELESQKWLKSLPAHLHDELQELVEERMWLQANSEDSDVMESIIRDWVIDHGGNPEHRVLCVL